MNLPPINYKTYIKAPPEKVFEMLTTADGLNAWFTQKSDIDLRPGGILNLRWENWSVDHYTTNIECPIVIVEPNSRFAFQWKAGDSMTTVDFKFKSHTGGTILEVTESGHTTSEKDLKALVECASGWGEALCLLKMRLEHGAVYEPVP